MKWSEKPYPKRLGWTFVGIIIGIIIITVSIQLIQSKVLNYPPGIFSTILAVISLILSIPLMPFGIVLAFIAGFYPSKTMEIISMFIIYLISCIFYYWVGYFIGKSIEKKKDQNSQNQPKTISPKP